MRRRSFLVGLVGVAAGCSADDRVAGPTTTAGTTARTTNSTTDSGPTRSAEASRYRLTNLETTQQTDTPEYRYVLTSTASYSEAAVEREETRTGENRTVVPLSSIDSDPVREAVSTAIDAGAWRSNTLPEGLREAVDETDFFVNTSNGENATRIGLSLFEQDPGASPALDFDARVLDDEVATGNPGALELSLTNDGSDEVVLSTGTMPPFGVVLVEAPDADAAFLLWRPYEKGDCVSLDDDGVAVCAIGRDVTFRPGETVARRYEVLPPMTDIHPEHTAPPGPGMYRYADEFVYAQQPQGPRVDALDSASIRSRLRNIDVDSGFEARTRHSARLTARPSRSGARGDRYP